MVERTDEVIMVNKAWIELIKITGAINQEYKLGVNFCNALIFKHVGHFLMIQASTQLCTAVT